MQYIKFPLVTIPIFYLFMPEPLSVPSINNYHKCVPCNPDYRYPLYMDNPVSPGHMGPLADVGPLYLCQGVVQYSNVLCAST